MGLSPGADAAGNCTKSRRSGLGPAARRCEGQPAGLRVQTARRPPWRPRATCRSSGRRWEYASRTKRGIGAEGTAAPTHYAAKNSLSTGVPRVEGLRRRDVPSSKRSSPHAAIWRKASSQTLRAGAVAAIEQRRRQAYGRRRFTPRRGPVRSRPGTRGRAAGPPSTRCRRRPPRRPRGSARPSTRPARRRCAPAPPRPTPPWRPPW